MENIRREGRDEVKFSCPYPSHQNGDANASAYMNIDSTAWYCHSCLRKGDAISFTASMMNISPVKARILLREAYDPSSLDPDRRNVLEEVLNIFSADHSKHEEADNLAVEEEILDQFSIDWKEVAKDGQKAPSHLRYMLERGFSVEALEEWEIGHDEISNRVTIPIRNDKSELIGVKGRAVRPAKNKYMVIGDNDEDGKYGIPRYMSGKVVYGLARAHEAGEKHLIIVEGELNVIALWQMGYANAVALNGARLTATQAKLITKYAEAATFMLDSDTAGSRGVWGWEDDNGFHRPGALETLAQHLDVHLIEGHDDDAAGYLQSGRETDMRSVLDSRKPYMTAQLEHAALMP